MDTKEKEGAEESTRPPAELQVELQEQLPTKDEVSPVVARPRETGAERYRRLKAAGACVGCGEPCNLYALHCDACHAANREARQRKMRGKPWKPGSRGRRPRDYKEEVPVE